MKYKVRELKESENPILAEFLYQAIFIPEGIDPPPRSIILQPELQIYIENFGKSDDKAFVAEIEGNIIGAVWSRIINDYGHIDNYTPSLAISLLKEYRNFGIGTHLLKNFLSHLKSIGYKQVSLSVQKENYAVKMYKKVGFKVYKEKEDELIMIKTF